MIKMLSLSGIDNYQVICRGRLEKHSLRHMRKTLEEIRKREGTIRLITRIDRIPILCDAGCFVELSKLRRSAEKVIKKYAILSPRDWIKNMAPLVNCIVGRIEVRAFDPSEAPQAISWLHEE